jgi:hypothetical protein
MICYKAKDFGKIEPPDYDKGAPTIVLVAGYAVPPNCLYRYQIAWSKRKKTTRPEKMVTKVTFDG